MYPRSYESELSTRRIKLINNKFLQTKLIESGLTGVVQAKDHGVKTWFPLNLGRYDSAGSVKGENLMRDAVRDSKLVVLGDKVRALHISELVALAGPRPAECDADCSLARPASHLQVCADVVEALIFAAYETGDLAAAWTFCRIIKLPMPEIATWADFAKVKAPPAPAFQPPARVLDTARELQAQLKYQFKDSRLLYQALVRRSPPPNRPAGPPGLTRRPARAPTDPRAERRPDPLPAARVPGRRCSRPPCVRPACPRTLARLRAPG